MKAIASGTKIDLTKLFTEVHSSARYLTDTKGSKTDVILPLAIWENLLALLEELDDRKIAQEYLSKLKIHPESSGALHWNDVAAEWENDEKV